MSSIRFIINGDLSGRQDSSGARFARGMAGAAAFAGGTTAVAYLKQAAYDAVLPAAVQGGNGDYVLSTSNAVSPYKASDNRFPVRNNLILETNDKTLKIEIWDAKIDVSFENTIVQTAVTKRAGTVKERISAKDISFSVSGNFINDSQFQFPIDELALLVRLSKLEENFNVANVFINAYDVHKVILVSGATNQSNQKFVNVMPFSLKLVSDQDYELNVSQEG